MSMPLAATDDPHSWSLPQQLVTSRWLWCVLAVSFLLVRALAGGKSGLDMTLGDTDDATRIVQVHTLLGGGGWFDLTLAKIGGATPLLSHWSRLIDAPLALLISGFGLFTSPENALTLARIVWPSLLLLVFFRLLVAEAEARTGAIGGIICLALAVTCLTGLFQFRIGRIDHHNAMILFSLSGLLMLARSLEAPHAAAVAGALMGLALAVGYEPLALLLPLLGLAALVSVVHTAFIDATVAALGAMAATLLAALLITVAPSRWGVATCDALSINMILLVGCGAFGMALFAKRGRDWPLSGRLAALAATGAVSIATYLVPDTACASGPFGQVSLEAKRLWLVNVRETQSILVEASGSPLLATAFVMLAVAGAWAAATRWRSLRTIESAATAIIVIAAIPPALLQLKFVPYASFLATFAIALRVAMMEGSGQMTPRAARLAGVVALNQWTIALVGGILLTAAGIPLDTSDDDGAEACYKTANVAPLAAVPAGLVASSVNMGPYIAALTPHSVLAAPYHRIDRQIVDAIQTFDSPLAEAEARLRKTGARYFVACMKENAIAKATANDGTLAGTLAAKQTPLFLREFPNASPLAELRLFEIVAPIR